MYMVQTVHMTTKTGTVAREALEIALANRTLSGWMKVSETSAGGLDIANTRSGATYRIWEDDGTTHLTKFEGGRAMLEAGDLAFSGIFAGPAFVGIALADLL